MDNHIRPVPVCLSDRVLAAHFCGIQVSSGIIPLMIASKKGKYLDRINLLCLSSHVFVNLIHDQLCRDSLTSKT